MLSRIAAISLKSILLILMRLFYISPIQWALAMYSMLSAMISREGSE